MTRAVYTDLLVKAPRTTITFPTAIHSTTVITNLYKEASKYTGETYSATVPDTNYLFAIIIGKVSAWVMDVESYRSKQGGHMPIPPASYTSEEIANIKQNSSSEPAVDLIHLYVGGRYSA